MAGEFTSYLDVKSADSKGIRAILGIEEPDYRLRDAELLLRSIAFSGFLSRYKGNLKRFLDSTTRTLNSGWNPKMQQELDVVTGDIEAAIETTYKLFGTSAFQRFDDGKPTRRFNRAVYDVMIMSFRFPDIRQKVEGSEELVREAFVDLFENDREFDRWTEATTKNRDAVTGRIRRWGKTLGRVINSSDLSSRIESSALRGVN